METDTLQKLNQHLTKLLGPENGYFGHVYSWGQSKEKYVSIGYELSEDFLPTLIKMSKEQRVNLVKVMNYFQIHALSLKKMLDSTKDDNVSRVFVEITWSQFMIVIMFGMLEIAAKGKPGYWNDKRKKIYRFFETNLNQEIKDSIVKRYKIDDAFDTALGVVSEIKTFSDAFDHLWERLRSGFVHDASIEHKGLEWTTMKGLGTREDPIKVGSDVPVPELLQITWQAILHSYGYPGELRHPKLR